MDYFYHSVVMRWDCDEILTFKYVFSLFLFFVWLYRFQDWFQSFSFHLYIFHCFTHLFWYEFLWYRKYSGGGFIKWVQVYLLICKHKVINWKIEPFIRGIGVCDWTVRFATDLNFYEITFTRHSHQPHQYHLYFWSSIQFKGLSYIILHNKKAFCTFYFD